MENHENKAANICMIDARSNAHLSGDSEEEDTSDRFTEVNLPESRSCLLPILFSRVTLILNAVFFSVCHADTYW